jgi:hypothetical protein
MTAAPSGKLPVNVRAVDRQRPGNLPSPSDQCPVNLGWRKANESKLIFTLDLLGIRRGRPNNGHLFPKNAECWDGFRLKRSFTKARLAVIKAGLTTIITTITTKDREAIYG